MHHVAGRLNNLVCGGRNDVTRDAGRKATGERRDEPVDDALPELERPWLIRDLVVGRVDHEAGSRLNAKAVRAMLFDVLRRKRALPVTLHIRPPIRGARRIESSRLGKRAVVERSPARAGIRRRCAAPSPAPTPDRRTPRASLRLPRENGVVAASLDTSARSSAAIYCTRDS